MTTDRTGTRTYVAQGLTDVEIEYPQSCDLHPVYHRYPTQFQPQPAYVQLDATYGHLVADWQTEIGPCWAIHDDIHRWGIEPQIPREMLCDLLDAIAPLAARLCDGDQTAADEIADLCERYDDDVACSGDPGVQDADDWLQHQSAADLGITPATTERELIDIGERIEQDAASVGVTLWGLGRTLEWYRQHAIDLHEDDLLMAKVDAAYWAERDEAEGLRPDARDTALDDWHIAGAHA